MVPFWNKKAPMTPKLAGIILLFLFEVPCHGAKNVSL